MTLAGTRVVALEEHYWDPEVGEALLRGEGARVELRRAAGRSG